MSLECIPPSPGLGRLGADRDFPPPAAPRRKRLGRPGPGSSPLAGGGGRDFTQTPHVKARTAPGPGAALPRRISSH